MRTERRLSILLGPVIALAATSTACERDHEPTADRANGSGSAAAAAPQLAGIYPDQWTCDKVVTTDTLSQLLGGPVRAVAAAAIPPQGVPNPCTYLVEGNPPETWVFDIDCRDGMKKRADALFDQYRKDSTDQVSQFTALADAGLTKPVDGGAPIRAPEGAIEVAVGAKGLDHHGQGLLFIDDDAPCYVRIVGRDPSKRLELGKLLAKQLTFANAPMTPRPFP